MEGNKGMVRDFRVSHHNHKLCVSIHLAIELTQNFIRRKPQPVIKFGKTFHNTTHWTPIIRNIKIVYVLFDISGDFILTDKKYSFIYNLLQKVGFT